MNESMEFISFTDLMLSTPAIIVYCVLLALSSIKILPAMADFVRSHTMPYRTGIPGMAKAALIFDLLLVAAILAFIAFARLVFN